jgi:membrane protein implicated in regulation of membrane protease activity
MWKIMLIVGLLFFILEIFTPAMFFLNLAFAAFLTAGVALFITDFNLIILSFVFLSAVMLLILRPILMNLKTDKSQKTGMENKYIGQIAKVISPITKTSGAITIYGERWEARYEGEGEIPEGANVKIIGNESLIIYVERID